jgi:phage shock protein C
MQKRIYRSNVDNKIAGVCGGLGEYFDIDPTIVRIIMFLLIFAHGAGLIIYIVGWIVMPKRPLDVSHDAAGQTGSETTGVVQLKKDEAKSHPNSNYLWPGLILIIIGLIFLAHNMWWWFGWGDIWPLLLIAVGAFILVKAINNNRTVKDNHSNQKGIANESGQA